MCHSLHKAEAMLSCGTQRHMHRSESNTCMRIPQALKQVYSQGYPESAMHVQESIGSRNSAIHNDYHTSLRPSSMLEPRYPSLKVVRCARSKTHIGMLERKSSGNKWFRDTMATGTSLEQATTPESRGAKLALPPASSQMEEVALRENQTSPPSHSQRWFTLNGWI
jgi:hypothetical protein